MSSPLSSLRGTRSDCRRLAAHAAAALPVRSSVVRPRCRQCNRDPSLSPAGGTSFQAGISSHNVQRSVPIAPKRHLETDMPGVTERTLAILEYLATQMEGTPLALISAELDIPRSACHRLLADLKQCGYVRQLREHGDYVLTT